MSKALGTMELPMSWISKIKSMFSAKPSDASSLRPEIGNTEPICPYCSETLDKMPGRKKRCPFCGGFIYVRTRPSDEKKILVREDQIPVIEEQWAVANGTHEQLLAEREAYEKERDALKSKFGREPSENDIRWSMLNMSLLKHAQNFQWGLYRNTRLAMGDILRKESKEIQALDTYLEVCYLDANGPSNCGTRDPEILRQFPPFDPKSAMVAPGVIGYIDKIIASHRLTQEQVEQRFIKLAKRTGKSLNLPVDSESAWKTLKREIYRADKT
jgi:DNA-directed RNA polymerase subunit RPC12/RpoP